MELERLTLDGEKIIMKGREIKAIPIGEPEIVQFRYDDEVESRIREKAPEGANAYTRRICGTGATPVQYYRVLE